MIRAPGGGSRRLPGSPPALYDSATKRITTKTLLILLMSGAKVASAGELPPEPVCGDVNGSSSVNTSDALLLLRKGVGQSIQLDCSSYEARYASCNAELEACLAAPAFSNDVLEDGDDCEAGDLNGATCVTLGFAGGSVACAAGCTFDTTECYEARFDASGETIVDHEI